MIDTKLVTMITMIVMRTIKNTLYMQYTITTIIMTTTNYRYTIQ